ncbi:hypothetical protein F5Y10DRAFT_4454 [Nemania abortiva]|nr:hypothetical protein F5Y10DRAFT_4454 [Nemania abortiva]
MEAYNQVINRQGNFTRKKYLPFRKQTNCKVPIQKQHPYPPRPIVTQNSGFIPPVPCLTACLPCPPRYRIGYPSTLHPGTSHSLPISNLRSPLIRSEVSDHPIVRPDRVAFFFFLVVLFFFFASCRPVSPTRPRVLGLTPVSLLPANFPLVHCVARFGRFNNIISRRCCWGTGHRPSGTLLRLLLPLNHKREVIDHFLIIVSWVRPQHGRNIGLMSLLQSFRNLSPKTRIGVGLGLLAWGAIGLQLSDRAEERYFKPTEEDRAALRQVTPRITVVDKGSGVNEATATNTANSSDGSTN